MGDIKERPILFSGPLVRAILDGRKTETRRPINQLAGLGPVMEFQETTTPGYDFIMRDKRHLWNDFTRANVLERCPFGKVGDVLYVRETFQVWSNACYEYPDDVDLIEGPVADGPDYGFSLRNVVHRAGLKYPDPDTRWRPSIHMPKWAARIWLRVTEVRVERVQDITEEGADAEGVEAFDGLIDEMKLLKMASSMGESYEDGRMWFATIWDSIYGNWGEDPWVWVVRFEVMSTTGRPAELTPTS